MKEEAAPRPYTFTRLHGYTILATRATDKVLCRRHFVTSSRRHFPLRQSFGADETYVSSGSLPTPAIASCLRQKIAAFRLERQASH